jgi:hypothetical protein
MDMMRFYEITTHSSRFWVRAARASDALREAQRILGHDEFKLERSDDLQFRKNEDALR